MPVFSSIAGVLQADPPPKLQASLLFFTLAFSVAISRLSEMPSEVVSANLPSQPCEGIVSNFHMRLPVFISNAAKNPGRP